MLYPLSYEGATYKATDLHVRTSRQGCATEFIVNASTDVHAMVTRSARVTPDPAEMLDPAGDARPYRRGTAGPRLTNVDAAPDLRERPTPCRCPRQRPFRSS
jgi:hypothetical protein